MFNRLKRFSSSRKIRSDILFVFLTLQISTIVFLIAYTYGSGSTSILGDATRLMKSTSSEKVKSIRYKFNSVEDAIILESLMINDYEDVSLSNKKLIKYGIEILKRFEHIDTFFLGLDNGIFFQILRVNHKTTKYQNNKDKFVIKEAVNAIRLIKDFPGKKTETWYYLNSNFDVIDQEELDPKNIKLKFKEREWYKNVFKFDDISWTDIYMVTYSGLPGISTSYPVKNKNGKTFGAIICNIHLKTLADVLKKESFNTTSLIVDSNAGVVVHPKIEKTVTEVNQKIEVLPLKKLEDKSFIRALEISKINKNKNEFLFDNNEHIAYFYDFGFDLFKNWTFISVSSSDYFIGDIKRTQKYVFLFLFFILLCSILWMIHLANKISRPVVSLVEQTDKIRRFDLTSDETCLSEIGEIRDLQNSISRMRANLITFSKFVPKNLARLLTEGGFNVEIGGTLQDVTVMFSNIKGFTKIGKSYTGEELVAHLSEYFDELTKIIIKSNGTIDKYNGDSVMAFWGAPVQDEKHILHSCEAALYCQKRLVDLNRKWAYEKKMLFHTRLGIHTGKVIAGNLGSSERMNYTVIGDVVNLSSRLDSVNKTYGTSIAITEDVYNAIQEHAVVRIIDIISVKGKKEKIRIFELLALKDLDPFLLPTMEELKLCEDFNAAFNSYLNQEWNAAIDVLETLKVFYPDDQPTRMLINRCRAYIENPPGKNWDPAVYLTIK